MYIHMYIHLPYHVSKMERHRYRIHPTLPHAGPPETAPGEEVGGGHGETLWVHFHIGYITSTIYVYIYTVLLFWEIGWTSKEKLLVTTNVTSSTNQIVPLLKSTCPGPFDDTYQSGLNENMHAFFSQPTFPTARKVSHGIRNFRNFCDIAPVAILDIWC